MGVHHSKKKNTKHKIDEADLQLAVAKLKRVYEHKMSQSLPQLRDFATKTSADVSDNHGEGRSTELQRDNVLLPDSAKLSQHPEVTKLQNRQNARLEDMEQRIAKIRHQVKEAAIRRRQHGPRVSNSCSTQTGDSIRRRNTDVNANSSFSDTVTDAADATGEVIPVHVLTAAESRTLRRAQFVDKGRESSEESVGDSLTPGSQSSLEEYLSKQKHPLLYVLFPLLLPLLIVAIIVRLINPSVTPKKHKSSR